MSMRLPSHDELLSAHCKWTGEHQQISYEVCWWGMSDYKPLGIWNYYIILSELMFSQEDWKKLELKREIKRWLGGSFHEHFDYDSFPDIDLHGGATYGNVSRAVDKESGEEYSIVKIGCDYSHLFDEERGYPYTLSSVRWDAMHSIDKLCELFPRRRIRCAYSGRWGEPDEFYTARNGGRVRKDYQSKAAGWPAWEPVDA